MDTIMTMVNRADSGSSRQRSLLSNTIVQNAILKLVLACDYPFVAVDLMKRWCRFKALAYFSIRLSESSAYLSSKLQWWLEFIHTNDTNGKTSSDDKGLRTIDNICYGHPSPHPDPKEAPTWTRVCASDDRDNGNDNDNDNDNNDTTSDKHSSINDNNDKNDTNVQSDYNEDQDNRTEHIDDKIDDIDYPTWTNVGDDDDDYDSDDDDDDEVDVARLRCTQSVHFYICIMRYFADSNHDEGIDTLKVHKPWNLIGFIKNNSEQFTI